jgi:regulator of RNase E activity RraA
MSTGSGGSRTSGRDRQSHEQAASAVESVGPGDVLVIDARGDIRAATLGDILAARIMQRGCGGVAVLPGDLIVGDGEGVVAIPRAIAEEVVTGVRSLETPIKRG